MTQHATFQHVITMVVTAHRLVTRVQAVQESVMQDAQITGSVMTSVILHATFQNVSMMLEIAIVSHQAGAPAVQEIVIRDAQQTGSVMAYVIQCVTLKHVKTMLETVIVLHPTVIAQVKTQIAHLAAQITGSAINTVILHAMFQNVKMMPEIATVTSWCRFVKKNREASVQTSVRASFQTKINVKPFYKISFCNMTTTSCTKFVPIILVYKWEKLIRLIYTASRTLEKPYKTLFKTLLIPMK